MVSSLIICQKKIYAGAVFRETRLTEWSYHEKQILSGNAATSIGSALSYSGICSENLLSAIPDEIYIEAGEKVSYEFDVPVSVVLKEEEATVF